MSGKSSSNCLNFANCVFFFVKKITVVHENNED